MPKILVNEGRRTVFKVSSCLNQINSLSFSLFLFNVTLGQYHSIRFLFYLIFARKTWQYNIIFSLQCSAAFRRTSKKKSEKGDTDEEKNEEEEEEGKEEGEKQQNGDAKPEKDDEKKDDSTASKKEVKKEDASDKEDKNKSGSESGEKSFKKRHIELLCIHCGRKCLTFAKYKIHLSSGKHIAAMRRVAIRQKAILGQMRLSQRNAQRELEKTTEDLAPRTNFCPLCKLNYKQPKLTHQNSESHKNMKKFLMPYCRVCKVTFKSPMLYENHLCSLEHIKVKIFVTS